MARVPEIALSKSRILSTSFDIVVIVFPFGEKKIMLFSLLAAQILSNVIATAMLRNAKFVYEC